MGRSPSDRVRRSVAAGIVLLLHVALVGLFLLPHVVPVKREPELVIATILEQPRPRNLSFGPVAITVNTENVLHLQRLAPKIQDIPVDEPEPAVTTLTVPEPASAPLPQLAKSGMEGDSAESSGVSGGGNSITLLMRFIPRYPLDAALHQQEGATAASLRVDASGRVRDVKIVRSSGSRSLDEAAVDAFRKWKFAPVPPGSATDGVWVQTEQRFILYRFRYSRLSDRAAEHVNVQAVQPATDQHTPGSQKALRRFIDEVRAGTFASDSDAVGRDQLEKMHAVLEKWGAVKSIEFTGIAGSRNWAAYGIRMGAANGATGRTVEVKWNLFEVQQEHATTEWLVAVDREGAIWAARASPAPWL
jgi:protein TonB